ncbi:hypothetical protein EDD16DRAFT_1517434 [Pisolithus croceorrhizus]|nr:hypothetical protein EDD16DRAFT_1517434 [Pisolithus croceorrhizus]KAI6130111.1 hypothetical protein EV401DRAFT_1884564 [Pisolithus croceorrhizus]KAI6160424.1 hypothetical protein EDD17DRAFT_1760954 [Pisolithus thermaeus]
MRGIWNRKAPETYGKRVVDCAKALDGVVAGKEFGTWVANLLRTAELTLPGSREGCWSRSGTPVKLVVPSLRRFAQKQRQKEFSNNLQNYIKLSAEGVETDSLLL